MCDYYGAKFNRQGFFTIEKLRVKKETEKTITVDFGMYESRIRKADFIRYDRWKYSFITNNKEETIKLVKQHLRGKIESNKRQINNLKSENSQLSERLSRM